MNKLQHPFLGILLFPLLLFFPSPIFANPESQTDMIVSKIAGQTQLQDGKQRVPIKTGQHIQAKDILVIGAKSVIQLLDPQAEKQYTVKGPYTGTVMRYVQRHAQTSVKNTTKTYMNYLLTQVQSKGGGIGSQEDSHATINRVGASMLDDEAEEEAVADSVETITDTVPTDSVAP